MARPRPGRTARRESPGTHRERRSPPRAPGSGVGERALEPEADPALEISVIVAALLGLLRLARLARMIRALRLLTVATRALRALRLVFGRRGLVYVGGTAAVLVLAGGALIAVLEPETVQGGFWAGVWWAG